MRFAEFRQHGPKSSANVFVFVCDDDFLIEESRAVWSAACPGTWLIEKLNLREFEDIEFARLSDEARTPSLFSQSRILLVMNCEKLSKGRIEDLASLQGIESSSLKVVLLFAALKAADAWTRAFPTIIIDPIKSADAIRWLVERYELGPDVARYVVENIGMDLFSLHYEVEKLRTYAGDGRAVTVRNVDEVTLRTERFAPFDLDDAILARNAVKTVHIAGAMLDDGMEPLQLLGKILRVWRQLFVAKGLASKRSAKDVALAAGVPPFKANELAAACRKYSWKELAFGFRELLQLDRRLKSSNPDVEASFEMMLWKLTGQAAGKALTDRVRRDL